MGSTVKNILNPFTYLTNLRFLIAVSGQNIIFPLYHVVSNEDLLHLKNVQKIRSVETFEKDLDTLLKFFKPISLQDYLTGNTNWKENRVVLTFDDGLRECHDVIAPILKKKGIPAVFFLNNSFIDNMDIFFRYKASLLIEHYCKMDCDSEEVDEIIGVEKRYVRQSLLKIDFDQAAILDSIAESTGFSFEEYLKSNQVYMTGDQVKSLISDGFEIGSHSFDHPNFDKLPQDTIREQVVKSIEELNKRFGLSRRYFSFPFSSDGIPLSVIDSLLTEDRVDALLGTSGIKRYPHSGFIQRIPMEAYTWSAYRLLKTEYLYYYLKAPFGKNRYRGGE